MADEQAAATEARTEAAPKVDTKLPFAEQMRAIDPNVFEPEPAGEPAAEASTETLAEEKPKKGKAKADAKATKVEVPEDATPAELEQLKQLAAKLGFSVDEQRLSTAERAEWRKYTTNKQRELERLEQEANERVGNATKEFEERFQLADKVWDFKKTRDYQQLAKTLGFDDWDKLQEDVLAHHTDPNYRRIREMEERLAEKERAETERTQREEAAQLEARRIQGQNQYRADLSAKMAQSKDPLVREMAADPSFVMAVFRIQQEHYDPVRDATIEPEEAASKAIRGAAMPLRSEMKGLYERLHRVFGAAPPEPAKPAGTTSKPKPRTDALPASNPAKVTRHDPSQRAWFQQAAEQMRQAAEEERRERIANGHKY